MNELTHYGVKGMRWGIRRRRPTTVSERRARTKRALKIAGAVAGGAALGYLGYKNRGAIANYSANRFADAQRFARSNLTKAGMLTRARRQEREAVKARRERRETAYKIHRHAYAPQRLRNEHSKANIEFLRRKSGGAGKGAVNSPDSARMSFDKAVANHLIVSGRFKSDPRRSFASQVADHRHRFAPTRMRYEAKNNTMFVGPKSGSSKSRRKNRGVYGRYK